MHLRVSCIALAVVACASPERPAPETSNYQRFAATDLSIHDAHDSFDQEARPTTAPSAALEYGGALSLLWGNDWFLAEDDGFTNGVGFTWQSNELSHRSESNFLNKMVDVVSFLPKVRDPGYEHYLAFTLGQSMFTATDITDPDPPLDDQPYAGLLFLDPTVYAQSDVSVHAYRLRLGVVGPSSYAEEAQKFIHDLTGSDEPQGWHTQLSDEPVLNLSYEYQRRWLRGAGWDVTPSVGAALGNYATMGTAAIAGRIGWNLPHSFGSAQSVGAYQIEALAAPPRDAWQFYFFGALQGYAVAHFLPLDGNTFEDSRSVESEPFAGIVTTGLSLARGRFKVDYSLAAGSESYETQLHSPKFGVIKLTWYL